MNRRYFLALAGLFRAVMAFSLTGCDLNLGEGGSYSGSYGGGSAGDDTEDMLLVSGSGETINLEYNTLIFPARLNWEDGDYYFAPDPDGSLSGHKIICAATISEYDLVGDCFRDGRVCHFDYYESWSEANDKDAYYASSTSCKTAADVGPFLVPLESPRCGEDPYPACPPDDFVPGDSQTDSPLPTDDSADASLVDGLIQQLCDAAARCDSTLTSVACVAAMDGEEGKQIWDNFGLVGPENQVTTDEVKQGVADGSITVDENAAANCLHELIEACDAEGESFPIGDYGNVENLILEDGACPLVFSL